jgi:hypothetical protein
VCTVKQGNWSANMSKVYYWIRRASYTAFLRWWIDSRWWKNKTNKTNYENNRKNSWIFLWVWKKLLSMIWNAEAKKRRLINLCKVEDFQVGEKNALNWDKDSKHYTHIYMKTIDNLQKVQQNMEYRNICSVFTKN